MNDSEIIGFLLEAMTAYRTCHRDGTLWQQLTRAQEQEFLFTAWSDVAAILGGEPDPAHRTVRTAVLEQALWLARQERLPERPRIVAETVDGLGTRRYAEKTAQNNDAGSLSPRAEMLCRRLLRERQISLTRG